MKKIVMFMTDIHVAICIVFALVVFYSAITPLPKSEIKLGPPEKIQIEHGMWI